MAGKNAIKNAKAKARAKAKKAAADPGPGMMVNDSFEHFEFRDAPGKGIGAFATKAISAGTILSFEKPLFLVRESDNDGKESDIEDAYSRLSATDKQRFQALRDPDWEAHKHKYSWIVSKFSANTFQTGSNGMAGCYAIGSRFNHSCLPNTVCSGSEDGQYFKTLVDIEQDEELTFCYMTHLLFMTTEERRPVLRQRLSQDCKCDLCCRPPSERIVSDMRRFLLRRVHYKLQGHDVEDAYPEIKGMRDHEYGNWAQATLYALLMASLAEAEGTVAGQTQQFMFTMAAKFLVVQYYTKGFQRIPQVACDNIRTWQQKAHRIHKLDPYTGHIQGDIDWAQTQRLMDSVGDTGDLPPLSRFKDYIPPAPPKRRPCGFEALFGALFSHVG